MYRQKHPPGLEYVHMQKHWEAMSDEALAAAALQAEDRAFTVLVARLLPPLRAMAESYRLPGLDRDDLVQEGFLGVMSAVRHYHPGLGEFTPYALTCARNSMGSSHCGITTPFRRTIPPGRRSSRRRWWRPQNSAGNCTAGCKPSLPITSAKCSGCFWPATPIRK